MDLSAVSKRTKNECGTNFVSLKAAEGHSSRG